MVLTGTLDSMNTSIHDRVQFQVIKQKSTRKVEVFTLQLNKKTFIGHTWFYRNVQKADWMEAMLEKQNVPNQG